MPEYVDRIHDALMQDPDFQPMEGRTKDEAAWAIAQSKFNQMQKNNIALSLAPLEKHEATIAHQHGKYMTSYGPKSPLAAGKKQQHKVTYKSEYNKFIEWMEKQDNMTVYS